MLFCRVAVNSKTAALQHCDTAAQRMTPEAFSLTDEDFDIRPFSAEALLRRMEISNLRF